MVSGKITVSKAMTVSASLPSGDWFNESSLKISSGYDAVSMQTAMRIR